MKTATRQRTPGRPREFDEDKALHAAMRVFWEKGYDGTSLSDLTEAMGINRPSIYTTFGNKEALYKKALESYLQQNAKMHMACLAAPTAREGITCLLYEAVKMFTDPKNPHGCMGTQSIVSCSSGSAQMKRSLDKGRAQFDTAIKGRIEQDISAGKLPAGTSSTDLARYVSVVLQGLATQAKAGSTQKELLRVVDVSMAQWPTA